MTGARICSFSDGKGPYKLNLDGKLYYFDFSERFGPLFETKTGREVDQQKIPVAVLDVVSRWFRQGKRHCMNGFCVWRPKDEELTATAYRGMLWKASAKVIQDDRCGCPKT